MKKRNDDSSSYHNTSSEDEKPRKKTKLTKAQVAEMKAKGSKNVKFLEHAVDSDDSSFSD